MRPSQLIGQVVTPFGDAFVYVGRYSGGGAIAVQLVGTTTGEPLGVFSTNLAPYGARIGEAEFCAKVWSENEPLVEPMQASGLFEDTGRVEPAGHVLAPVWCMKHPEHVPPRRGLLHSAGIMIAEEPQRRCCVCREQIFDDEGAMNTCEDCLDNVQRDPEAFIDTVFADKDVG